MSNLSLNQIDTRTDKNPNSQIYKFDQENRFTGVFSESNVRLTKKALEPLQIPTVTIIGKWCFDGEVYEG